MRNKSLGVSSQLGQPLQPCTCYMRLSSLVQSHIETRNNPVTTSTPREDRRKSNKEAEEREDGRKSRSQAPGHISS